ncbi:MAG TPA: cupin domain-containing protein [Caulobacter sp.]|nr:cupin domain-containing protein [Caulobacter sp.]
MTKANIVPAQAVPWVPLRAGMWMRPLCFLDDGYSLQLRVAPGISTGPHRHTGEVNALMLSGHRRILNTGERLGPGDFVHEPPGNEDNWGCEGEEHCVIMISLTGRIEYLDAAGNVDHFTDTNTAQAAYLDYCARETVAPIAELFRGSRLIVQT